MYGRSDRTTLRYGFTLVEILIVVVILGILAALVIPQAFGVMQSTRQGAFIVDLKRFSDAAMVHYARTGEFLEDSSSGVIPVGFDEYINPEDWEGGTPINGVWDAELDSYGIISAIGVHFDVDEEAQDDAFMLEIDQTLDDGDLDTGAFQKIASARFYYIIDE